MLELAKGLFRTLARVAVLPLFLLYRLERIVISTDRAFQGYSQLLALIPGLLGEYLRREFYRLTLKHCSTTSCISFGTIFSTADVEIGERVYIGNYCIIGHARIGEDTLVASRVSITSGRKQHGIDRVDQPIREQPGIFEAVTIGRDCWIGEGAVVGVNVGPHAVVAAGSVVSKAVSEFEIVAGNPAVVIRTRN